MCYLGLADNRALPEGVMAMPEVRIKSGAEIACRCQQLSRCPPPPRFTPRAHMRPCLPEVQNSHAPAVFGSVMVARRGPSTQVGGPAVNRGSERCADDDRLVALRRHWC